MKLLLLFLLITNISFAQESEEFIDPTQLKRGMKGYALTVFQGTEPEKMGVEVIAYMPNRFANAGMVLVRMSGANVERTGVAAGMSGSPVYIEGKLLGALAYTWANAKELMAGIVPIRDMLSDKQKSKNVSFPQAVPIQTAWAANGVGAEELIQTIKTLSSQEQYPKAIEEFKIVPSSRSNGISPLKPGDAVAIKLVEGDLNLASIGTVTYVNGEDVYIFGHPMDQEGTISLPLAKAEIYDIIASRELSFKLGSGLPQTIGSTVFDGLSSVYGRFDRKASTVPVSVNITAKNYQKSYNLTIARSRKYLPALLRTGIGAILQREAGTNIEKRIKLSWKLEFTNQQIVENEVIWVKDTPYDPRVVKDYWSSYITTLWNNPLTHLVPEKVSMEVEILDDSYDYSSVYSVTTPRSSYISGESIPVKIALRPLLGDIQYTNLTLTLPKNLAAGTYTIMVGSTAELNQQVIAAFPTSETIRSEQQLINELRKPILNNTLQVSLVNVETGGESGVNFLNGLPKSRQSFFKTKNSDGQNILSPVLVSTSIPTQMPILSVATVNIQVVSVPPVRVK